MTNTRKFWQRYFEALAEEWARRQRLGDWPDIQRVKVDGFPEGQCHLNAEHHAAAVGGMVIHGYLFMQPWGWNVVRVIPHSIVRRPDGRLVDPTPNEVPPEALPFLGHERPDVPFELVVRSFPVFDVKIETNTTLE